MEQTAYVKSRLSNVLSVNYIVTLHSFALPNGFSGPGEAHDFWEMVYVRAGQVTALANGEAHLLTPGEAIFHRPGEFHNVTTGDTDTAEVFIISFVCSSPAMRYFNGRILSVPPTLR